MSIRSYLDKRSLVSKVVSATGIVLMISGCSTSKMESVDSQDVNLYSQSPFRNIRPSFDEGQARSQNERVINKWDQAKRVENFTIQDYVLKGDVLPKKSE